MTEEDLMGFKSLAFKYGDPLRGSILTLVAYIEVLEAQKDEP